VIYGGPVRVCAKLRCLEPAVATAALRYGERVVWIGDLVPAQDPNLFDLCESHAARLTAPYGWRRVDDRGRVAPATPAGA
jgi:hypothetical protein